MLNRELTTLLQETSPVTIRALRSITRDQVLDAVQALAARDTLWQVDQHDDYDGYLSLLITHELSGALFVISGVVGRIEVAELREDELHPLGTYQTIDEALLQLQP